MTIKTIAGKRCRVVKGSMSRRGYRTWNYYSLQVLNRKTSWTGRTTAAWKTVRRDSTARGAWQNARAFVK